MKYNVKGECRNTGRTHFVKGHKPWGKGVVGWNAGENHPQYGRPKSEATRQKISQAKKGIYTAERSGNWKGGITPAEKMERVRFKREMNQIIFTRDNYTCQMCQQVSGYLHVDHIKKWSDYPELRFDQANCRTLCMACHYFVTFKRQMPLGTIWGKNQRAVKA